MTATYTSPGASDKDAARFTLGDTGPTSFDLTDEELEYSIATAGSMLGGAALAADALAARYTARAQTETNGDLTIQWGDRAARYRQLAFALRDRAAATSGVPSGLGLADPDLLDREPEFSIGRFDSPASTILDTRTPG